jgi:hypothetical protein
MIRARATARGLCFPFSEGRFSSPTSQKLCRLPCWRHGTGTKAKPSVVVSRRLCFVSVCFPPPWPLNFWDTNSPIGSCRAGGAFGCPGLIRGGGSPGYISPQSMAGASTRTLWQIGRMIIPQAIIFGLLIVAASVAARVIAAAEYRLGIRDEARRIAVNIAKLPKLLRK